MAQYFSRLSAHRIGIVSTRFNGTDGVSLETQKWAHVLDGFGQKLFYFAGECDQPEDVSFVVPQVHFKHPEIWEISKIAYSEILRSPEMSSKVHTLAEYIKTQLYAFKKKFGLDMLLIENALSIPMNIPLGIALTEFIAETNIPTIAHHHDFYWERQRYLVNCVGDYLEAAFPPRMPSIHHVVINSIAGSQLAWRQGLSSWLVPNVMDFDNPPPKSDGYTANLRADLKIPDSDYFFLQPTRVVSRKGIEHAIELVKRLGLKISLVISHEVGDEGYDYQRHVDEFANMLQTPITYVSEQIGRQRGTTSDGKKIYALGDLYPEADLVTYPSLLEGFGNAFLEAVYYSRPILVNNYTIYATDIRTKGFHAVEFDGFITDQVVDEVRSLLNHPDQVEKMVQENYSLAKKYFSYTILERQLYALLHSCFGDEG